MASHKERIWLAEYFKCWDATAAARRADYKWPSRVGWQKKQKFAKQIEAEIQERIMGAEEALLHLSDQARADISPFVTADGLDVEALIAAGLGHLIKSIKHVVTQFDDRREVEIYDKQAALKIVLAHHTKGPAGTEDNPMHVKFYLPDNQRDGTEDSGTEDSGTEDSGTEDSGAEDSGADTNDD